MSAATPPAPDLLVEEPLPEMEIDGTAAGTPPMAPVGVAPGHGWGGRVYSAGASSPGVTRVGCYSRWRGVGTAQSSGDADGR